MRLYKNKYRDGTVRLRNWDYRSSAAYFVTICTKEREHWFGKVVNAPCINSLGNYTKTMQLSEIGMMVRDEWEKTPGIRPDMNLVLDEFVVMPNHFHGIIIIGDNEYNKSRRCAMHGAPTIEKIDTPANNKFGVQSKNLASVIRGFKSAVSIQARRLYPEFSWQKRFYEHIIRDGRSLTHVRQYISSNPIKWDADMFNSE